jgi:hypothetical protein
MDWLRSEDLKEEKDVTAPTFIIAGTSDSNCTCIWRGLIESWFKCVMEEKQTKGRNDPIRATFNYFRLRH